MDLEEHFYQFRTEEILEISCKFLFTEIHLIRTVGRRYRKRGRFSVHFLYLHSFIQQVFRMGTEVSGKPVGIRSGNHQIFARSPILGHSHHKVTHEILIAHKLLHRILYQFVGNDIHNLRFQCIQSLPRIQFQF